MAQPEKVYSSTEFKPRKPWLSGIISLLFPSLGQIYNGQIKKGIFIYLFILLVPYLFGMMRLKIYFWAFAGLLILLIAIRIYAILDAAIIANRRKKYVIQYYNTWYYYLIVMILCIVPALTNLPYNFSVQSLRVPTLSGSPTLQINDIVVADYEAYKNTTPTYGDLVVFKGMGGNSYTFRVIGLPYDTVDLIDNLVTINKQAISAEFIQNTTDGEIPVVEFEETLPNGHTYSIYRSRIPFDSVQANVRDIVVPEDSYFLMGDNRDFAADSRYIGSVHIDDIMGKIIYNAWSNNLERINIDFKER